MFTVAKIKCQVLPILDVKRLQYLFEDAEICIALFSALFFMFSVTPMDLCYLNKFQLFILYLNKNITKICDLFKGGGKICQVAAVFIDKLCLLLF
jgi:hypothetical protein